MLKLNTYIQYFEIKLILSINVSSLSLFENFNGTTGRDGFPGKRQKLVPGQTFGKEREIAVTNWLTKFALEFNIWLKFFRICWLYKSDICLAISKICLSFTLSENQGWASVCLEKEDFAFQIGKSSLSNMQINVEPSWK